LGSPFLEGFTKAVLSRLLEKQWIEIEPGSEQAVIASVARGLGGSRDQSLVSLMVHAFIATDEVIELYVDNDQLKELITELGLR
jgi:hypothetical protein